MGATFGDRRWRRLDGEVAAEIGDIGAGGHGRMLIGEFFGARTRNPCTLGSCGSL